MSEVPVPTPAAVETPEQTLDAVRQATEGFYAAFPDVRACAQEEAARILKLHTGQVLDPDKVYWHRFANAVSNGHTFTGWEHYGTPVKSFSMTDLTMHRFDVSDQINAIDLDTMSGFYRVDASSAFYDQTNEVPIAPLTVMNDLWEANFAQAYKNRLETFWSEKAEDARLILKSICFSRALEAMSEKRLSRNAFKLLINSVVGPSRVPPTLAQLRAHHTDRLYAELYSLSLGSISATDIIRVHNNVGHEILYIPPDWFRAFAGEQELYDWVRLQAADPERRNILLSHFGLYRLPEAGVLKKLHVTLDLIVAQPWVAGQKLLNLQSRPITEDIFSYLAENLHKRLQSDAKELLHSNWDLRRKEFLVDIGAFVRVTAGLAPASAWIAGAVVAASALSLGAHAAQALHGETPQERSRAASSAVMDAVSLLFSLPMLKGTTANTMGDFSDLAMEGNATLAANQPLAHAVDVELSELVRQIDARGRVFYLGGETRYITLNDQVFEVRFVSALDRWMVINPLSPDDLTDAWAVEVDWRGQWEPYAKEMFNPEAIAAKLPEDLATAGPELTQAHRLSAQLEKYETAVEHVELIDVLIGRDSERLLTGPVDTVFAQARTSLLAARNQLAADSRTFFEQPRPPRIVSVPVLGSATTPEQFFDTLYSDSNGLVMGQGMDSIASHKLLIKYMSRLKAAGVQTLYTDTLIKELHQGWLDHFMNTGYMPGDLVRYLNGLTEQSILARYTPVELVHTARLQGIKIKALDCAAAHKTHGLALITAETGPQMRNYYAYQRILAHQAARPESKWIALINETRVSTFQRVPGLADLTNTLGMRVKDTARNLPLSIAQDPGQRVLARQDSFRTDVLISIGTLPTPTAHTTG